MSSGERSGELLAIWSDEIAGLIEEYGGGNKRLEAFPFEEV